VDPWLLMLLLVAIGIGIGIGLPHPFGTRGGSSPSGEEGADGLLRSVGQ